MLLLPDQRFLRRMALGATLVARRVASHHRVSEFLGGMKVTTMGEIMDRYMFEVAPKKAPSTYGSNKREMGNLRAVFGHMKPEEITAPDIYAYMDKRGAPVRANRERLCSRMYSATRFDGASPRTIPADTLSAIRRSLGIATSRIGS
jgi:hypothetical protein